MTDRDKLIRILEERAYPAGFERLRPGFVHWTITGSLVDPYQHKLLFNPDFLQCVLGYDLVSASTLFERATVVWPAWVLGKMLMSVNEDLPNGKNALDTLYALCFG